MVPAGSAQSLTGNSFRKLVESLLRVPYRTLREQPIRKVSDREKREKPGQDGHAAESSRDPADKPR